MSMQMEMYWRICLLKMKTRFLIVVVFFIFTLGSVSIVYGLNENINPDINDIDENKSRPAMITLTNATGVVEEDISYNRICPENTDWHEAPNQCDRRENYTRTQLKDLYDGYYQYKGSQWMEMKKAEMDSVISKGSWMEGHYALSVWLGHTQRELPFENINVYLYYFLNGQAPDIGGGLYAVNDEFEPVITLYYASPGAIVIIGLTVIIGTATGAFLSFKKILLHPKRKTLAVIGFALIFVGVSMYSIGLFELTQSQINQMGEEKFSPVILHTMSIFLGIPIALAGIPVILHGMMQRFSIMMTLLTSSGLVISWVMFIISRFD